ncbi:transaldolase [Alkanindiges sp. WGS2144]|uniref:transaldolase n=1 Tax=Alkanindiges sp. WGS2144 TaxID=3366808 RepID=UPI0037507AB1
MTGKSDTTPDLNKLDATQPGNNSLAQLCKLSTVVADTGDLNAIDQFKPLDATTNPSLITAAASLPENRHLIEAAYQQAQQEGLNGEPLLNRTIDILTVKLGIEILKLIKGRVSTEVDPNFSFNREATIERGLELIKLYEDAGINKDRVLIKIAATWQGIQAAKYLEEQGIHCNLTLIFNLHQASACADAKVTLISPFVGRILDWYKKKESRDAYPIAQDPGVNSVKQIYTYYKQHGLNTQVMAASFRSSDQVLALAGCDLLTIAPGILDELQQRHDHVQAQLSAELAKQAEPVEYVELNEGRFEEFLNRDEMAYALLQAGIDGFIKARDQLSHQLRSSFGIGEIEA